MLSLVTTLLVWIQTLILCILLCKCCKPVHLSKQGLIIKYHCFNQEEVNYQETPEEFGD